jgi:hypothetical protein
MGVRRVRRWLRDPGLQESLTVWEAIAGAHVPLRQCQDAPNVGRVRVVLPRAADVHGPHGSPAVPGPQRRAREEVHVVEAKRVKTLCERAPEACLAVRGRGDCKARVAEKGEGPSYPWPRSVCQG